MSAGASDGEMYGAWKAPKPDGWIGLAWTCCCGTAGAGAYPALMFLRGGCGWRCHRRGERGSLGVDLLLLGSWCRNVDRLRGLRRRGDGDVFGGKANCVVKNPQAGVGVGVAAAAVRLQDSGFARVDVGEDTILAAALGGQQPARVRVSAPRVWARDIRSLPEMFARILHSTDWIY